MSTAPDGHIYSWRCAFVLSYLVYGSLIEIDNCAQRTVCPTCSTTTRSWIPYAHNAIGLCHNMQRNI